MNREMLLTLIKIEDDIWDEYIYHSDVMYGKLTKAQKTEFTDTARQCALEAYLSLPRLESVSDIEALLKQKQIHIEEGENSPSLSIGTFALFTEPDTITLFETKYEKAREVIARENLEDITQNWDFKKMALVHELFHVYEAEHPDMFTMQKVLCLWKVGRLKNLTKVEALREIAACEFVRLVLRLKCHPCVMEVFMLQALNEKMGLELYSSIISCAEKWRKA